jgi:peptide/nickel transport system substrate-binding protein
MIIKIKKSGQKAIKKVAKVAAKTRFKSKEHIKENLIRKTDNILNVRLLVIEWLLLASVIILLATVQFMWYSRTYQTTSFVPGGSYTEATIGRVNTLNPLYATTNSERAIARLLFNSLVTYDTSGHLAMDIAKSIKPDESGQIWTVELKNHIKWSDGEPVTATDVVYTFDIITNQRSRTIYSSAFSDVEIAKKDDFIVEFTLPVIYNGFPHTLRFPILPEHILRDVEPEHLYGHHFSTHPVGSGAFVYNATQNVSDDEQIIYLNKNPLHFRGEAMLDRMSIRTYADRSRITSGLGSGAISGSAELLPTDRAPNGSVRFTKSAINSGVFAFLNCDSPVLKDTRVRSAIRHLLDIGKLREEVLGDEPALDHPILKGQVDVEFAELPKNDAEAANDLLVAAGYTLKDKKLVDVADTQISIHIVTIDNGYLPKIAENIEHQLSEAGFAVTHNIFTPGADFIASVIQPRNYDILIYEIDMGAHPDPFVYYHSSQAGEHGLNLSNYNDPVVDDLILAARKTLDKELSSAKYAAFIRHWVDDVPAIGIYQVMIPYYFNTNVRKFSESNRLISPIDRFADVIYWASTRGNRLLTP